MIGSNKREQRLCLRLYISTSDVTAALFPEFNTQLPRRARHSPGVSCVPTVPNIVKVSLQRQPVGPVGSGLLIATQCLYPITRPVEFERNVEQFAHRALFGLFWNFIEGRTVDAVKDREVKQHLLIDEVMYWMLRRRQTNQQGNYDW
jgi:hypothetical protein